MQAWYAYFAGAAGYSYGHCHNWDQYQRIDYADSPGALQMGVLRRFLAAREWWKLVPDQTILRNGEENGERRKVAVRAEDHSAAYVYYPTNEAHDGTFRNVQVQVTPPRGMGKLTVRTRTGYYASRAPASGN